MICNLKHQISRTPELFDRLRDQTSPFTHIYKDVQKVGFDLQDRSNDSEK